MNEEDWINDQNEEHFVQTGSDFTPEQRQIMHEIYVKYADKDGFVDWEDHTMNDSAWYIYMDKIIGIERDVNDLEDDGKFAVQDWS